MMGISSQPTSSLEGSIIVSELGIPAFYDPPDPLQTATPDMRLPRRTIRVPVVIAWLGERVQMATGQRSANS